MDYTEREICQHALLQIWETLYDHDTSNHLVLESEQQRKAAFANIEMLQSFISEGLAAEVTQ